MAKVQIVEMGLRDGLQSEAVYFPLSKRVQLAKKLADAGLTRLEIGAFVSPKWVPQMSGTGKLARQVLRDQQAGQFPRAVRFSTLVPNLRGLADASAAGMTEIALFGAASESFSQRNTNCSIKESLQQLAAVAAEARRKKILIRAYLSTVFGCPYEGKISQARVLKLCEKYFALGIFEISLGDTIGVATPKDVRQLLKQMATIAPPRKVALHFHDTRGTAIANILASLDLGYHIFDTSIGGLGGCPYAPGAAGNVATEDVLYMLNGMGLNTGVDIEKLIKTTLWLRQQIGRQLPSRLSLAGDWRG